MVNKILAFGLFLSLLVHLFFYGIIRFAPQRQIANQVIEIAFVDKQPKPATLPQLSKAKGQVVEQSEKAINDEIDPKAKFLSLNNQKVIKETKASKHGAFQNSGGSGKNIQQTRPPSESNPKKESGVADSTSVALAPKALPTLASLKPSPIWQRAMAENNRGLDGSDRNTIAETAKPANGLEESQNNDHLPDVESGQQTLLNTREFVYYSYYARIKKQLTQQWEPRIKEKISRIFKSGRTIASHQTRITEVIIVLNSAGTLVKVQVLGKSGIEDLDESAVEAFRAAAPFPNPPKGMVDQDGTIKITWSFVLEA